jgi:hypothetical protein
MIARTLTPLALVLTALALPAAAQAGSYDVLSCLDSPTGAANNAWQNIGAGPGLLTSQSCAPNMTFDPGANVASVSGISAAVIITGTPTAGSEAYWRLTAPTGAAITQIAYRRYTGKVDLETYEPFLRTNTGQVLDGNCAITAPLDYWCAVGSTASSGTPLASSVTRATIAVPSASRLEFGVRCGAQNACPGGALFHKAWASIYASTVTITENAAPTLTADPAVGAWAASGWLSGQQTVRAATATDTVGIKQLRLLIDGQQLATSPRTCDYTFVVPCSAASGATIAFDADQISEGPHTLALQATDAANNTTTVTKQILVDAAAPTAPQITAGQAQTVTTGQPWSVSVSTDPGAGSPIAALRYRICTAGQCGAVQTAADTNRIDGTLTQPGTYEVRAWAVDAAGNESEAGATTATVWVQNAGETTTTTPVVVSPTPTTSPSPSTSPTAKPATTTSRPLTPTTTDTTQDDSARERTTLRVRSLRVRGRIATVRVRSNATIEATVRVTVAGRTVRRAVVLDEGTTTLRIRLRRKASRGSKVTARVNFAGDESLRAASASRTTRIR